MLYAHVCSRMLTHGESGDNHERVVCCMLTYAHVCSRMLMYAESGDNHERVVRNLTAILRSEDTESGPSPHSISERVSSLPSPHSISLYMSHF